MFFQFIAVIGTQVRIQLLVTLWDAVVGPTMRRRVSAKDSISIILQQNRDKNKLYSREDESEELQEDSTSRGHHSRGITESSQYTCTPIKSVMVQHQFQTIMDISPAHLVVLRQRIRNIEVLSKSVGMGPNLILFQHIVFHIDAELKVPFELDLLRASNSNLPITALLTNVLTPCLNPKYLLSRFLGQFPSSQLVEKTGPTAMRVTRRRIR